MREIIKATLLLFAYSLLLCTQLQAQWQYGGIQISGHNFSEDLTAISDGNTGIFVAWRYYPQQFDPDIYVQHLDSAGYELWPHEGVPAVIEPHGQYQPRLALDDSGGVFVSWTDLGRQGPYPDIYAQRISASGQRLWGDTGLPVIVRDGDQSFPLMVADGAGGAVIYWADSYPPDTVCVVAQRIDRQGDPLFGPYGMRMTTPRLAGQSISGLLRSSDGNMISCWFDYRTDGAGPGIYAQKFSALGEILWDSNGVPVIVNSASYENLKFGATSWGGLYCLWVSSGGIYFQWLDSAGQTGYGPGGIWKVEENAISDLQFTVDPDSGALAVWLHNYSIPDPDVVYAAYLDTTRTQLYWFALPVVARGARSLFSLTQSAPGEFEFGANDGSGDGLKAFKYSFSQGLLWGDSGVYVSGGGHSGTRAHGVGDMTGGSFFVWQPEGRYVVRANRVYPDGWVVKVADDDVNKPERLALFAYPNPFNSSVTISYSNLSGGEIKIYDIQGKSIRTFALEGGEDGKINWDATDASGKRVSSGVYFARAAAPQKEKTIKILLLR